MRKSLSLSFVILIVFAVNARALIRHVRSDDYPTIQSAFDSITSGGDTVLVDIGEYAEALVAPIVPFTLLGNVEPDTGAFLRPTIDASLLPEHQRDPCLTLRPGSIATIERIRFHNQNAMIEFAEAGGVYLMAGNDTVTFNRCLFDSVSVSLYQPDSFMVWPADSLPGVVTLENCVFWDDSFSAVWVMSSTVNATNCLFDGDASLGWMGMRCAFNSDIRSCTFRHKELNLLLTLGSVRIVDCIFGPSGPHFFFPVELSHFSGTIANCVFTGLIQAGGTFCLFVEGTSTGPATIENNIFIHDTARFGQSKTGIMASGECNDESPMLFQNNTVVECSSMFRPKGMDVRNCAIIQNNRFISNDPPDVRVIDHDTTGNIVYRHNIFLDNGYAIRNSSSQTVDARDNWWGDSTGPRATTNPNGLGDSVGDDILYEPWTLDTNEWLAVEEVPVIPKSFQLEVFPNPFNSSAMMMLKVPEPTIIQVELFDMLGRRVKEIWSGAVAIEKKINVDARELPSGIYFARATEVHFRRPLATAKLLLIR